jgi:hypothetical protein
VIGQFPQGNVSLFILNNLGVVFGTSATRVFGATRPFGVQFIGPVLPTRATVNASNEIGILAGTLNLPCDPSVCFSTFDHAFRWTDWSGLKDLETRPPTFVPQSVGLATNVWGDVAGILYGPSNDQHPFLWTEKDGMHDLGFAFGRLNPLVFLNNRRDLAGQYIFGSNIRSFIWSQSAGFRDLGFLSDIQRSTYAEDLNGRKDIACIPRLFLVGIHRLSGPRTGRGKEGQ